ncbi:MAG: MBL fold metallo-hydrolase [Rhizobiales bacterium]|nr:MBL fold metallo-hydrolase [Hyphomicrobiales bacterium]
MSTITNSIFKIKFWGTRGTRQVHSLDHTKFGSNTICVEVQCGERVLVFDAGSGIVNFGVDFDKRPSVQNFDLFLSHAHYDHVEGIPHLSPLYQKQNSATIWSGALKGIVTCHEIFDFLMMQPYFPVKVEKFEADIKYNDIADFESLNLGDGIRIHTTRLKHPGGATGYRVEYAGKSFAFITDCAHSTNAQDDQLVAFLKDVDLFAYDCSYTDEEFEKYSTYGHSTWQEALKLRSAANAGGVYAIHHMPFRNDDELERIHKDMKTENANSGVAYDTKTVKL